MSDYFNGTGTIGFTCDNCGRELLGCTWVNGMKFCAKCYQETFGNTNPFEKELKDKISDLEAKLAKLNKEPLNCSQLENGMSLCIVQKSKIKELETKLANVEESARAVIDANFRIAEERDKLKQQLAEKEKEIEQLNNRILFSQLQTPKEQILNILGSRGIQYNPNQDKILFAVEKLQEAKRLLEEKYAYDVEESEFAVVYEDDIDEIIDNQIKQLKGMK